jgi:hypothetical protein
MIGALSQGVAVNELATPITGARKKPAAGFSDGKS